jgi:hypothetical protein
MTMSSVCPLAWMPPRTLFGLANAYGFVRARKPVAQCATQVTSGPVLAPSGPKAIAR